MRQIRPTTRGEIVDGTFRQLERLVRPPLASAVVTVSLERKTREASREVDFVATVARKLERLLTISISARLAVPFSKKCTLAPKLRHTA
jgi:hypothetical protein